jgi:NAD-specific glutamate dehydrogenase
MATEYILFDRTLCDRLVQFITDRGLVADVRPDAIAGFVIVVSDTPDEDLESAIAAKYDALMEEQFNLIEAEEGGSRTVMAVTVTLPSGQPCVVPLTGKLGRRVYEHFTVEEVQTLVTEIAAAVANPSTDPLCKR